MLSKTGQAVAFQFLSLGVALLTVLVLSRFFPVGHLLDWLHDHVAEYQPWSTLGYPLLTHHSINFDNPPAFDYNAAACFYAK